MKKRKVMAMVMAGTMLLSMGIPASASEEELTTVSAEEGFPLEEQVTISAFIVQLPGVVELPECTVLQDLEEKTNIKLDLTIVPQDGAKEKLNLLLAGGDYPELIIGTDLLTSQDLEKYGAEEQILMPLNDLIEQYGTNIKKQWETHPEWEEQMKSSDGNIYGIPGVDSGGVSHGNCSYKFWMNKDWLETLGLEVPTTTEELKTVLKAFKEQDPNGNGIADEIPMTGATGTWAADPYLYLLNAFGYFDTNYYYLKDGTINSILDQDYLKEGLAYVHELYSEGLIDQAAFTQDESQLAAVGNNADVVITGSATCGHIGMFVNINDKERYSQYEVIPPVKGPNGYRGIPYTLASNVSGANFAITDVCEHPEEAMKLADLLCTSEWAVRSQVGKEGAQWEVADENTFGRDGATPAKYKYLSYSTQTSAAQTVDCWDWTFRLMEPNWKDLFEVSGDILDATNYEARLYRDTVALKEYAADVDTMPALAFASGDSETYTQLRTAIADYANNSIIEFITGVRDIEKDWDTYLAELNRLGYKDMLELVQKTVDAKVE